METKPYVTKQSMYHWTNQRRNKIKMNENENTRIQNPWDTAKTVLKGKFIVTQSCCWTQSGCCHSLTQLCLTLQPHGLQRARLRCPSSSPRACSNPYSLSQWCHPTISTSVVPFASYLQSFPASGSSPMSQFFASGGHSIRVSAPASVLPMSIRGWFPLWLTGLISLQSKRLSRVFSKTKVQNHQFFSAQLSF